MSAEFHAETDTGGVERMLARLAAALSPARLAAAIGSRQLEWLRENADKRGIERPWAPPAPATRARGGGGGGARLAAGFAARVSGASVEVAQPDPRAAFFHLGTRPFAIRPRRARALRFFGPEGVRIVRAVRHPGQPARPLLPSPALAGALAAEAVSAGIDRALTEAGDGRD
ncbi:MAG: hypothetical protein HY521_15000 [Proteobacteria bacterium]|nr:hypothetical protein [Pseudomonadota bacterium]